MKLDMTGWNAKTDTSNGPIKSVARLRAVLGALRRLPSTPMREDCLRSVMRSGAAVMAQPEQQWRLLRMVPGAIEETELDESQLPAGWDEPLDSDGIRAARARSGRMGQ